MKDVDQAKFWDERFATEAYVFGTEPNAFLRRSMDHLPKGGRILAVADGEGRNSVFLAERNFDVVATDISAAGLAKARRLAYARNVTVDFRQVDLATWDWPENAFDAVVAIFIQFAAPELRDRIFAGFHRTLKSGGTLLMQGYRPEQLVYGTGGPPTDKNLYTDEMVRNSFADWEIVSLDSHDSVIEEGTGHSGLSALIDLIARKPHG